MTLSEEDIQAPNSTQCPAAKLFQTGIYTTTARVFMVLVKFVHLVLDPPRQHKFLTLSLCCFQPQLTRRRPGQSVLTTPRDEADT